jgi:hypothetical protein
MGIFEKITSEYGGFKIITEQIGRERLDLYSDRVYQQYCDLFDSATYLKNVEWVIRHFNASKKMTLSALFYTQTEYLFNHHVKNLTLYSMYYSLFNACCSNILLLPNLPLDQVHQISHSKAFKDIDNYFVRSSIFPADVIDLLNELRLMRELYSYHLPLSGTFMEDEDRLKPNSLFQRISVLLPIVLQIGNLLSYLSHYAWDKKVGKALDEYEKYQEEVDQIFFSFIEHHDYLGKYCIIDNDDYSRQGYVLRQFPTPFPISWFITEKMCEDLECGWEQFENEGYDINEVGGYLAHTIDAS